MNITSTAIAVSLALVVAIGFLLFGSAIFTPFTSTNQTAQIIDTTHMNESEKSLPHITASIPNPIPTTLSINDLVEGTGTEAKVGDTITVNYVGALADGTIFDSSINREPFTFTLGGGQVIQGWDQGLVGMKEGGKRFIIIPPSLGYGSQDLGVIPPNSTLLFEVELLKVGE